MSVSVIVSNFNGERFLPKLLETLRVQRNVTMEIIVVDRFSTDRSMEILKAQPDVIVVQAPPELGLVAGYHTGVSKATCSNLFFCNEDMWFEPDCLYLLERHISRERRIGISDPWQWTYDGDKIIHMGTQLVHKWDGYSVLPSWKFEQTPLIGSGEPTAMACAGAMMVDRALYDELGGWDTSFFLDFEDADFCIRAWQRGWRCVSEPNAKVYHAVGMSNTKVLTAAKTTVSRKRYVWGASNCMIVAAKYFRWRSFLLTIFARLDRFARNTVKLRFRLARFDAESIWLSLKRIPQVLEFRRSNRTWAASRPGESYFRDPDFRTPMAEESAANE
jgi:N-acetylglucosaminyl-diphospho-decaprenol L-rhamnosyltransferase